MKDGYYLTTQGINIRIQKSGQFGGPQIKISNEDESDDNRTQEENSEDEDKANNLSTLNVSSNYIKP